MLVKEILGECLVKMGAEDFTSAAERTETQQTLIGRLLAAFNIAYREAVTEYLPLVAEEEVEVRDGEIPAASLGRKIIYPLSLVSEGRHYRIRTYPDRVVVEVSDCGCGFEVADDEELSETGPFAERGRGIRLMRLLADAVSISYKSAGEGTVVRLVKLVRGDEAPDG